MIHETPSVTKRLRNLDTKSNNKIPSGRWSDRMKGDNMWQDMVHAWFREEILFDMMAEAVMWADGDMPEWVAVLCRSKGISPIAVYDAAMDF